MPAAPPQPPVGDGAPAGKSRGRELWGVAGKKVRMAVRMSMGFHTLRDMDGEEAVSESSLKRVKALGEGAFAAVDLCWYTRPNGSPRLVAVKKLHAHLLKTPAEVDQFVAEAALLRKFHHPNIVEFIGMGTTSAGSLFLVQEYAGTQLKKLVFNVMTNRDMSSSYDNASALRWMLQIARALKYLHNANPKVIHRDLKLENILMQGERPAQMVAKVSDFGLSAKVKDRHLRLSTANMDASESDDESCSALQHGWTTMLEEKTAAKTRRRSTTERYNLSGHTGSLMYMAPEVFRDEPYNEKADVFSFGMMMYEVMQRYLVIQSVAGTGSRHELERYAKQVANGFRPPLNDAWPEEVRSLVCDCWAQNADERPSMDEVVERLDRIQKSGVYATTTCAMCTIS